MKEPIRFREPNEDGWVYFHSPLMHEAGYGNTLSRADQLAVYRGLRTTIKNAGPEVRGFVTETHKDYDGIVKLLYKIGFMPFRIKNDNIWFKMEVDHVRS